MKEEKLLRTEFFTGQPGSNELGNVIETGHEE